MNKPLKITMLFLMAIIIAAAATAVYFNIAYSEKIFPNITINEDEYSGLTEKEAFEKLDSDIKNIYKDGIVFAYKDKPYKAEISETGAEIDIEKTVSNAFDYGHSENIFQNLKEQAALIIKKSNFEIETKINDLALENCISKEMSKIETLPKNFDYKYEKETFIPVSAKSGMVISKDKIKKDILNNLSNLKNDTIKIELAKKEPEVTEDLNGNAATCGYNLLNKKVILKYNSDIWEIAKEDLVSFIKFEAMTDSGKAQKILGVKASEEKIKDYLISLVPLINREPVNAQLEFKNGKVEVFSLDQEGIALRVEKSAEKIESEVFAPDNYLDSSEKKIEIEMITEKVQPEITIESIDNMGITALLATGESNFSGSPKNRKHNIAVGAGKFHGVLIGPGDEFSFNEVLGSVGPKEGYLPELVIKNDGTVPEYGGGLCQVSTTAFRAAVKAGLEITERRNHAYPVKYYSPQGTDATIYPPHPDLRFKNNTPAYILIQTRVEGNKLYFDFYGADDGRKVVLKDPYIYEKKSDGSMKATWTQEVYDKDGNLWFQKKFYSSYNSPALYPHKNPLE